MTLPFPHPLDFDWRYDTRTARSLATLLYNSGPIIAFGAPTVARLLQSNGLNVLLVDRQPIQAVHSHIVADINDFVPDRTFQTAIVDAPWYTSDFERWVGIAAQAVGARGTVLASVWPKETRPNAGKELAHMIENLSKWADVERHVARLTYETPRFEAVAAEMGATSELSQSPRFGELIRLHVKSIPSAVPSKRRTEVWTRFLIENYQIAIRHADRMASIRMEKLPEAAGWRWPFVSARAPGLGAIDIWSSEGEVASLGAPGQMIETIRFAMATKNATEFEQAFSQAPELLLWAIPRPPYRRSIEWLHRR